MSTKFLAVIVLLLAGAAGLAYTNPTSQDYQTFQDQLVRDAIARIQAAEEGTKLAVLKQFVGDENSLFFKALLRSQTTRHNLGLCSLFETSLFRANIQVLGIGGQFIPLTDLEKALQEAESFVISPAG